MTTGYILRVSIPSSKAYNECITIRINELTPKNSKSRYSVWCDSEGDKPKCLMTGLTKNEALEVAQEHDILHKDHLLRIDDNKSIDRIKLDTNSTELTTV